ncbi:MAG: hypothetical protein ASARMPREDX12_009539 [Alectoria sarmentosa]|nr:MAG: hypothetical protein ASARMPREDX12_009539 [Alectoria sarmentosa]
MASLTAGQSRALETTERVASCFSLIGTIFIFVTFVSSPNFRRPINRLVFYASWGNTLCNIGTLMSESPIRAGANSHLCQFQGFLIQMFVPADAFWNLAMAINVYLTLFKKYNAQQLKALEWKYHLMCYGVPFVIAFIFIFVETKERGKIYGPAVLWCWLAHDWDFLRIAVCYGPAWVCIVASFAIYIMAGREIFKKRHQLRAFNNPSDDMNYAFKTTDYQVTSDFESLPLEHISEAFILPPDCKSSNPSDTSHASYPKYNVKISAGPRPSMPHHASAENRQQKKNKAAMEANTAAFGYTKVASLFFVSLLVTWVPSSINRVYSLIYPESISVPYAYAAGIVLSLMGFWNSVIYITTSRAACRTLFLNLFRHFRGTGRGRLPIDDDGVRESTTRRSSRVRGKSWGDSSEELRGENVAQAV